MNSIKSIPNTVLLQPDDNKRVAGLMAERYLKSLKMIGVSMFVLALILLTAGVVMLLTKYPVFMGAGSVLVISQVVILQMGVRNFSFSRRNEAEVKEAIRSEQHDILRKKVVLLEMRGNYFDRILSISTLLTVLAILVLLISAYAASAPFIVGLTATASLMCALILVYATIAKFRTEVFQHFIGKMLS